MPSIEGNTLEPAVDRFDNITAFILGVGDYIDGKGPDDMFRYLCGLDIEDAVDLLNCSYNIRRNTVPVDVPLTVLSSVSTNASLVCKNTARGFRDDTTFWQAYVSGRWARRYTDHDFCAAAGVVYLYPAHERWDVCPVSFGIEGALGTDVTCRAHTLCAWATITAVSILNRTGAPVRVPARMDAVTADEVIR